MRIKTNIIITLIWILLLTIGMFAQHNQIYVNDHGAKGDGITDDTEAIQSAIDLVEKMGGGHVIIPAGRYISGPIYLKSNLVFEIQAGATLICTSDIGSFFKMDRLPNPEEISNWKGLHTDYQMINGDSLNNVAIIGRGEIFGNGEELWWNKQKIRPYVIKIENSKNVVFENLSVIESPFHTFNFTNIDRLNINGITLRNDLNSPNTDGLHIVNCRSVKVSKVDFETGDDCILTPRSEDVLVMDSRFKTPWGFWWPNDSCKNITINNCIVDCQMLIKDFTFAENVIISNIVAAGRGRMFSSYGGPLKNVLITDIIADGWAQGGWFINGENITMDNVIIDREPGSGNDLLKNGFVFKDVRGLTLRNVELTNVENGSALYCENVEDLTIDNFQATNVPEKDPLLDFMDVKNVVLKNNISKPGEIFASIKGEKSSDLFYEFNEWNKGRIEIADEVRENSINSINAELSGIKIHEMIKADSEFKIYADLESRDSRPGLYPISLFVDKIPFGRKWIWLNPGEKKEVSISGPKLYSPQNYSVKLNNSNEREISLVPAEPKLSLISADLFKFDRIKRINDTLKIMAVLKNIGSFESNFEIMLKSNGKTYSKQELIFQPGEQRKIEFDYTSAVPGLFDLSINDLWSGRVKFYSDNNNSDYLNYSFDKSNNDLIEDNSGLFHNAEVMSNLGGTLPSFTDGISGRSIKFNGSSSYLNIPAFLLKFPMTITLWVKPDTLLKSSTAGRQMIIYASEEMGNDGYGPEDEIHLMRATGNSFSFWANTSNKVLDLRHPFEEENKWYFIAVVYDTTSKMYVNGELVSNIEEITKPGLESFADRIYIGRPTVDYLRYFNGELDELCFYNEVLNRDEIIEIYRSYFK